MQLGSALSGIVTCLEYYGHTGTCHTRVLEKNLHFLLFGIDCQIPTEAALLPTNPLEPTAVEDYREEVMLSLSLARELT